MIPTYKIVVGTANFCNDYFGSNVPLDEVSKIITYAKSVGIREFDTARTYANGMVEEILGGIDGISVYTKGDSFQDYDESLKHLSGSQMLGWLVHHPTLNFPYYKELKKDTHCAFGISAYSLREADMFHKSVGCDYYQIPFKETRYWRPGDIDIPVMIRKVFMDSGGPEKESIYDKLKQVSYSKDKWDRVVVGVDNVDQLKEIVDIWGEL